MWESRSPPNTHSRRGRPTKGRPRRISRPPPRTTSRDGAAGADVGHRKPEPAGSAAGRRRLGAALVRCPRRSSTLWGSLSGLAKRPRVLAPSHLRGASSPAVALAVVHQCAGRPEWLVGEGRRDPRAETRDSQRGTPRPIESMPLSSATCPEVRVRSWRRTARHPWRHAPDGKCTPWRPRRRTSRRL